MGFETPWGAWQLNEITLVAGRRAERNLNEGKDALDGIGKVKHVIQRGYRSLKGFVKKSMKIPENGIW